ncbi:hypothetical protein ACFL1L_05190, partial [Thermoplasmatota archaeon]
FLHLHHHTISIKRIMLYNMFKSKVGRIIIVAIITLVIRKIFEIYRGSFGDSFITIYVVLTGVLAFELVILIVEFIKYYDKKDKSKIKKIYNLFNITRKPRFFEYMFFLSLFIATIYSSFVASAYYNQGMNTEIIKNSWGFIVFYGFAIAFGWYHYIERLDE